MRKNIRFLTAVLPALLLAGLYGAPAQAELKVVATLSDLGGIARAVGGDDVAVDILCPGPSDPHFLPAKPSLARKVAGADLLIYNGLELEVGWLPQLIRKSRNPKVRPGARGELDCSRALTRILELPEGTVDRSQGDVHPLGNPHYTLDPRNAAAVAALVADRLGELDPARADAYAARAADFAARLEAALPEWRRLTERAAAYPLIVYHRHWTYLTEWLNLDPVGEIEHRPGIQPSPRHVQELIEQGRGLGSLIVVCATWDEVEIAEEVANRLEVPMVVLPGYSGALPGTEAYVDFIRTICERLAAAAATLDAGAGS